MLSTILEDKGLITDLLSAAAERYNTQTATSDAQLEEYTGEQELKREQERSGDRRITGNQGTHCSQKKKRKPSVGGNPYKGGDERPEGDDCIYSVYNLYIDMLERGRRSQPLRDQS